MEISRVPALRSAAAAIAMVLAVAFGLVATTAPAGAAPGDLTCTFGVVPNKPQQYLCRYNPAGTRYDGRQHFFLVTPANTVTHIWENSLGGSWSNWTGLGGAAYRYIPVSPTLYTISGAAVLRIMVYGQNGASSCRWYNRPSHPGLWGAWGGPATC
jgi:hypothetical protein